MKHLILAVSCFVVIGNAAIVHAMGNKPPVKEQPKYKLEILKMEFVPAPTPVTTTTTLKPGSKAGKNGR